jgi:hypothetical protein
MVRAMMDGRYRYGYWLRPKWWEKDTGMALSQNQDSLV